MVHVAIVKTEQFIESLKVVDVM